ncbi:MAG: tetratricopeptide repeat protein [Ekhidna sp.]|nr:tetratricopeptide repeat protein [Ekhidna sp.]
MKTRSIFIQATVFLFFLSAFNDAFAHPVLTPDEGFSKVKELYLQSPNEALSLLDELLENKDLSKEDRAKAHYYTGLALARGLNKEDQAIIAYYKALTLYEESKNIKGQKATLKKLAFAHRTLLKYDFSIDYFGRVLDLTKGDSLKQAYTKYNIGKTYRLAEQYDLAIATQKELLPYFESQGKTIDLVDTHLELGFSQVKLEEFEKAKYHYSEVLTLADKIEESARYRAKALNSLGHISLKTNDLQSAEKYLKEALKLFQSLNDVSQTAIVLNNLGFLASANQNQDLAITYFKELIELDPANTSIAELNLALEELITLSKQQNDLEAALAYSDQLINLTKPYLELHANLDNLNKQYQAERAQHLIAKYEMQKHLYEVKLKRNVVIAVLTTLFIIGLAFYLWYRKRSRHEIAGLSLHNDIMLYQLNPELYQEVQKERLAS